MKTCTRKAIYVTLLLTLLFTFAACDSQKNVSVWEKATYTEDTVLGSGSKTFTLVVQAEEKEVTFIVKTDKETVGDALMEQNFISGEQGAYGLYVKIVNGIEADYNKTKSYWAFNENGKGLMTGVDGEKITENAHYEFVYVKQ